MATDPTKVTAQGDQPADDEQPQPDADRALAEPDAAGDASKEAEPAYVQELRRELAETREAARRAQGSSDRNTARLERQVGRLEKLLTNALTANMTAEERKAFEKDVELERLREAQPTGDARNGEALREWQTFASRALEKAGIKHDDPALVAAFQKHNAGSDDPDDWQVALVAAITEVERSKADKQKDEATKVRENEDRKARNARRAEEGRIDRSAPSGRQGVRVQDMSDEEFDRHWAGLKAGAREREARAAATGR